MKTQHFLAAAAAFVLVFLMDYLWYGMLMRDFYTPMPNEREMPDFAWLAPGVLLYCLGLVYFYDKGFGVKDQYSSYSVKFGIWVTVMIWLSMALIWHGILTDTGTMTELLVDVLFRLVQTILVALVIGKVLGKGGRGPGDGSGGQGDALRPPGGG